MAGEVRLSYQEMTDNCTKLDEYIGEFTEMTGYVSTIVSSFTDVWVGQAKESFVEDYETLTKSFANTVDVMREITTMIKNYVNDMQEIDNAYGSGAHVSIQ